MVDELDLINHDANLVVPYNSRKRVLAWLKARFEWRDKRWFWITVSVMSVCVFLSSGMLMNGFIRLPISLLAISPLGAPVNQWMNGPAGVALVQHINWLSSVSPVDRVLARCGSFIIQSVRFEGASSVFLSWGLVCIVLVVLALIRLLRSPGDFRITPSGLSLVWKMPFFTIQGPVVPWSDVKTISLKKIGGDMSPEGLIEINYGTAVWQYKLLHAAYAVAANKFTLDLRNLESVEQKHRLGAAFEKYAPPDTVQAQVCEALFQTSSETYTELWLQALSTPSARQSLLPLEPGQSLCRGKYLIGEQLGVGGQGTAYAAQEAESDSGHVIDLVVKEFVMPVFVDTRSRKEALRQFLDEADLLKRLDHERVVKLTECFVEDHRGYLVLERVHGRSLKQIVESDGPFSEEEVSSLLEQMLDVLAYLHSQEPPVVHRDFAPDNLILGRDGVLKLVDFNVAQSVENSMTGAIVGKQSYVPPEQLRGQATPASDIYALGATLYFLLTGEDPEPLSVSRPALKRNVSPEIDALVAHCTQLDGAERFCNVEEIKESLRKSAPVPFQPDQKD